MKTARVFPTQTSMSPCDRDAYFGIPDLFTPEYDLVHISVAFTWDIEKALWLAEQWSDHGMVAVGGPAIDGELLEPFTPGMYLRKGVVATSRGCPNQCPWCFVKKPLLELEIKPGNNIVDNNFLACTKKHRDRVFRMLQSQKRIVFSGGLEAVRVTDKIAEQLRGLRMDRIFLAYDNPVNLPRVAEASRILRKYFTRRYLYCFVLIGYGSDTMDKAEERLREVWNMGAIPFAMLYRNKQGEYPQPVDEWKKFQRLWCRPALIRHQVKA